MPTFRLTLEYDGSDFEGWQVQPGERRTVQAVLERAIAQVTGAPVRVVGAGRTDSGVHAVGQVASVVLAQAVITARTRNKTSMSTGAPQFRFEAGSVTHSAQSVSNAG